MSHFDKIKHEKFPEIKDFTSPQNKLRNTTAYKLSTADWFWHNPFAFRYINIGVPSCFICGSAVLIGICMHYNFKFFGIVSLILFAISVFKFVQALRKRKMWKITRMNMYDQFLREYPEGRGVPKK